MTEPYSIDPDAFLREFREFCKCENLTHGYVCRLVLENSRALGQIERKQQRTREQVAKLRQFVIARNIENEIKRLKSG